MNKLTPGSNMRYESMRMILPEQRKALQQMEVDRQKVPRPYLSEDELVEIQQTLQHVIKTHEFVEISYYRDGFIKRQICTVAKLDPSSRTVKYYDGFGLSGKIPFKDVVGVYVVEQDGE